MPKDEPYKREVDLDFLTSALANCGYHPFRLYPSAYGGASEEIVWAQSEKDAQYKAGDVETVHGKFRRVLSEDVIAVNPDDGPPNGFGYVVTGYERRRLTRPTGITR